MQTSSSLQDCARIVALQDRTWKATVATRDEVQTHAGPLRSYPRAGILFGLVFLWLASRGYTYYGPLTPAKVLTGTFYVVVALHGLCWKIAPREPLRTKYLSGSQLDWRGIPSAAPSAPCTSAANLAGVQGIGDWGHDSDGESIDHDVLRDFH